MEKIPSIAAKNLSLSYDGRTIFEDLNFQFFSGELIGIRGRSGSGKSSLLHCLCGVIPGILPGTVTGEILLEGSSLGTMQLSEISTKVGIVFQNPDTQILFQTVEDEVAFGAENLCCTPEELEQRITNCLAITGISSLRHANPNKLSGGQKQLVVIASVLSMNPSILLLDEIFSHVDTEGQARLLPVIQSLAEQGNTIVMIDHNEENLRSCTRNFEMKNQSLEELFI